MVLFYLVPGFVFACLVLLLHPMYSICCDFGVQSHGLISFSFVGLKRWQRCQRRWRPEFFLVLLKYLDSSQVLSWTQKLARNFLASCLGKLFLLHWMDLVSYLSQLLCLSFKQCVCAHPRVWIFYWQLLILILSSLCQYIFSVEVSETSALSLFSHVFSVMFCAGSWNMDSYNCWIVFRKDIDHLNKWVLIILLFELKKNQQTLGCVFFRPLVFFASTTNLNRSLNILKLSFHSISWWECCLQMVDPFRNSSWSSSSGDSQGHRKLPFPVSLRLVIDQFVKGWRGFVGDFWF